MTNQDHEPGSTNNINRLETLLYQFIKLYDNLTLEHALMIEREQDLLKHLEKINSAIDDLNKLNMKIEHKAKEAVKEVSEEYFVDLTKKLSEFFENNARDFFYDVQNSYNQIKDLVNYIDKMQIQVFIGVLVIGGLIGGGLVFWFK